MDTQLAQQLGETVCVIIGFAIFYWILKKYAWGPILGTLDERQQKIQAGFDEIKRMQAETVATQKQYEERIRHIEAEARTHIQAAVAEGQRVAAELTEKARVEARQIVDNARKKIDIEVATARKQLHEDVIRLTMLATEKLLHERLTEDRDRGLVGAFISEMETKS